MDRAQEADSGGGGVTCSDCMCDPHPRNSDPRRCAFDEAGLFTGDNWTCGTMLALRDLVRDPFTGGSICQANDSSVGVIPIPGWDRDERGFILLEWYKHRGR